MPDGGRQTGFIDLLQHGFIELAVGVHLMLQSVVVRHLGGHLRNQRRLPRVHGREACLAPLSGHIVILYRLADAAALSGNRRFELHNLSLDTHHFVALGLQNRLQIGQLPAQIRQLGLVIPDAGILRRDFGRVFRNQIKLHLFGDEVGLGFRELILHPSQLVGGQGVISGSQDESGLARIFVECCFGGLELTAQLLNARAQPLLNLLRRSASPVHALFDEGSRQRVGKVRRKLGVMRIEGHTNDLAIAGRLDLEVLPRNIGGILCRVLRCPGRSLAQPFPKARVWLEFGPLCKVQFVGGLLDQCVLLQNLRLSLHVNVIRRSVRCCRRIDVAQVEEVLIHSLHLKAGHGTVQTGLGHAQQGGDENARKRNGQQSDSPAVQHSHELNWAAPLAVGGICLCPIPRRHGRIVAPRGREFRSRC